MLDQRKDISLPSSNSSDDITHHLTRRKLIEKSFVVLDVNVSKGINKGDFPKLRLLPRNDGFRLVWPKNTSAIVEMNALMAQDNDNNSSSIYQTFYASSYLQNPDNSHYRSYNPKQGIHIASFLGTFLILILCFILYKENKFRWCRRKRCSLNSRRDSYEKVLSARLFKRKPHSMTTASGVMRAGLGAAACALLPGRNEVNKSNLDFDKSQENNNIFKIIFGTGPYVSRPLQTGPFQVANVSSGLYNIGSHIDYDSSPQPDSAYYPGHNSLRSESEVESALAIGYCDHQVETHDTRQVGDQRLSGNRNFIKKKFKVPSFLIHHSRSLSKTMSSPSGRSPINIISGKDESLYSYSSSNITPSPIVEPNIHEKEGTKFFYPEVQNIFKLENNFKAQVGCGAVNIEKWLMYTQNKMFRRSFSAIENRRVAYPKPIPKLFMRPREFKSESLSIVGLVSPLNKKIFKKSFKSSEQKNGKVTQVGQDQSLQLRRKRNHRSHHSICAKSEVNDICSKQCCLTMRFPKPTPPYSNNDLSVAQNDLTPTSIAVNVEPINSFISLISPSSTKYEPNSTIYSSAHCENKPINSPESGGQDYSLYLKSPTGNQRKEKIVEFLFETNTTSNPESNGYLKTVYHTSPTTLNDSKNTVDKMLTYSKKPSYIPNVGVTLVNLGSK